MEPDNQITPPNPIAKDAGTENVQILETETARSPRSRLSAAERKKRRRKRRLKKALLWTVFYTACAVLVFCIVDIIFTVYQRKAAREQYAEIQHLYELQAETKPAAEDSAAQEELEAVNPAKWYAPYARIADKKIDFAALTARNEDVCGWITVDGTSVDYPILRSPDSDSYYLQHDIDGKASEHGAICMDPRCDAGFSSRVTMIYGHNMLDGSMFASLYRYYNDAAFFNEDHQIHIYFDNVMLTYQVVSAYEYSHEQPLYYYNMQADEEFLSYCATFLENRDMKARLRPDTSIGPEDHVLTLITSTNVRADQRLFVQAVLIHGE